MEVVVSRCVNSLRECFKGELCKTEKQEGANELLLRDEQGGGRKQKRHVPHHLFAQRLYSTLHSCLASLANFNQYILILPTLETKSI